MNRFVSTALAGALALSVVGVSATGASAARWHRDHRPQYRPAPHSDTGPALLAGAILGFAVGALMQSEPARPAYPAYPAYAPPPPPPDYAAYAAERHYRWCAATYRSYNGETDTWIDYRGVPHRCISP